MKVITGDIREAARSGIIGSKDYLRIKKKSIEDKRPAEIPEDKDSKLVRESVGLLKKAIEHNNELMQSNITMMQHAINALSELSGTLKKEPSQWRKIDVDVKRGKDGKIKSVEMKRKD